MLDRVLAELPLQVVIGVEAKWADGVPTTYVVSVVGSPSVPVTVRTVVDYVLVALPLQVLKAVVSKCADGVTTT